MDVDAVFVISHPQSARLQSALATAEFITNQFGGEVSILQEQPTFRLSAAPSAVLSARWMLRRLAERQVAKRLHAESSRHGEFSPVGVSRYLAPVDSVQQRMAFANRALYEKHVLAWKMALSNRLRGFIVMEDDALITEKSLDVAKGLDALAPVQFLDLAGGLEVSDLAKFVHIEWDPPGVAWRSSPPITNTTCAYWISANFAESLLPVLSRRPVKRLPIDWALNLAFSWVPGDIRHAFPTLLSHGSITGDFPSEIR